MSKKKSLEDMTHEEQIAWLEQYIADAPKRLAAHDRFATMAVLSMGATLLLVPFMFVIGSIIKALR